MSSSSSSSSDSDDGINRRIEEARRKEEEERKQEAERQRQAWVPVEGINSMLIFKHECYGLKFISPCKVALRWMTSEVSTFDDKSALVLEMAWCCQAPSHYLSQCWVVNPDITLPYGVDRPQWGHSLAPGVSQQWSYSYQSTFQGKTTWAFPVKLPTGEFMPQDPTDDYYGLTLAADGLALSSNKPLPRYQANVDFSSITPYGVTRPQLNDRIIFLPNWILVRNLIHLKSSYSRVYHLL